MKTILIIDDNTDVRENTAELLELNHFRVFVAGTIDEGFESARKHLPDIIICDMTMPALRENDFLKGLMADGPISNIPFIFFSNGSIDPGLKKSFPKEDQNYLIRPFAEEDLMEVVNKTLSNKTGKPNTQQRRA